MQGVQPLLRRYWTWRATSWSERGGRKEKVSKNLVRRRGFGGQNWIFFVSYPGYSEVGSG
jgi:hypothetical protein